MNPRCSLCLPCRDFGTEFLTCDCRLRWLLPWARNHSLQLSERTLCAYPSALHAHALSSLQESQLRCGKKPIPGPKRRSLTHSLLDQDLARSFCLFIFSSGLSFWVTPPYNSLVSLFFLGGLFLIPFIPNQRSLEAEGLGLRCGIPLLP